MSVVWLAPIALSGAALIVLPVAIHLFVRQQAKRVLFPSLRFVGETQLAAFRARRIEDLWLLLVRAAVIALATVALAGPVWQTESRRAATASRVSRAIVEIDDASTVVETQPAFRSATFHRTLTADAIADAIRWLNAQPSSAREIVFRGAMRRGVVGEADLAGVPVDIGIRFVPSNTPAESDITLPILTLRDGELWRIDRRVHLTADATSVTAGQGRPVKSGLIRISGQDQAIAEAALRVALGVGVPWRDFETPVQIRLPDNTPVADAADVVMRLLQRVSAPPLVEPQMIAPEQLEKWTRPPGPPSDAAPIADEGDRRWVWLAVLALLGVEWFVRRRAAREAIAVEARVA